MTASPDGSELPLLELNLDRRAKSYRSSMVMLTVLVHSLAPVTCFVTVSVLKLPPFMFVVIHLTMQAICYLNIWWGPRLYIGYHKRRAARLDPLVLASALTDRSRSVEVEEPCSKRKKALTPSR